MSEKVIQDLECLLLGALAHEVLPRVPKIHRSQAERTDFDRGSWTKGSMAAEFGLREGRLGEERGHRHGVCCSVDLSRFGMYQTNRVNGERGSMLDFLLP